MKIKTACLPGKRKNKRLFFASASFFLIISSLFSQQLNVDMNRDAVHHYEKYIHGNDPGFHTSIKPFVYSEIGLKDSSHKDVYRPTAVSAKDKEGNMTVGLLGAMQAGYDRYKNKNTLETAIGAGASAYWKNQLGLKVTALTGNSGFVTNADSNIRQTDVIPGTGSAYTSKRGYSYQNYSGYLSYSPSGLFNFQAGRDKHFLGDGYRSLFLSDVANNYPFLKIATTIWKIKYINLFAAFKDVTTPTHLKKDFKDKFGSFHYLSWNINKRINLSFFESVIWQGTDTSRSRGFDINYLNPVVFYRPVEYALGSSDNAFVGIGFKIKLFKNQQMYGQVILDEFLLSEVMAGRGWWANKQGFQLGLKSFRLFKVTELAFQTEVNVVRPYTYSHGSVQQNYAHFNQPLAHPMGANFMESVSFLNYQKKKWTYELKFISAVYGTDTAGLDYGKDIFQPYTNRPYDYGNKIGQGLKTNLLTGDIRVAYMLTKTGLKIEAGTSYRVEKSVKENISIPFVYLGIRTLLGNFYSDY